MQVNLSLQETAELAARRCDALGKFLRQGGFDYTLSDLGKNNRQDVKRLYDKLGDVLKLFMEE